MIGPGATLGILGGGQLGRMIAADAKRLGYRTVVLDPTPGSPAGQVCDEQLVAPVDDAAAAERLARKSDLVTLEWELIPAPVLERVAALKPLLPAPKVLRAIQDRSRQKEFIKENGFPQARYEKIKDFAALQDAARRLGFPCILKRCVHGYDGKGQARLAGPAGLEAARPLLDAPCVLEAMVPFAKELSVILARTAAGETAAYPVAENVHKAGILHTTVAPAEIPERTAREAVELATAIAEKLGHVGVMAVELFLLRDGRLLVNEIAPRVHNSGHYTLGACATSQFEQHVRAVCGLPLGPVEQRAPAVMVNLLGELWAAGEPNWETLRRRPEVSLHLYGKAKAAPGRKMGHFLITGLRPEHALAVADSLLKSLSPSAARK